MVPRLTHMQQVVGDCGKLTVTVTKAVPILLVHLLDRKALVAFEWQDEAGGFVETDVPEEV